jgi:tetratricopeptide (TPR) repeat protein
MEIDSYQQCPCHQGKKIKFCCGKELVSDLNAVLSKEHAGQTVAALEQLERTIARVGPRECLLTIQTHILISHGETEKAKAANKTLLDNHPNHITGMQHASLIALTEGKTDEAISKLQDTMDAITGNELPITLANAFRALGIGLLNEGQLIAGRAHLEFASELKGGQDEELQRMVYDTFGFKGLPIALKRSFHISKPPSEDVEWHKKYVNVGRALARGQFRKALKFLEKIDSKFPDQPIVVEGIAIVSGFLGMSDLLPDKFRRVSNLPDHSPWEAIEAELLAQAVDATPAVPEQVVLRKSFGLGDASAAMELAASHNQLVSLPPDEQDPFGEGPAPKHSYAVLNKPSVKSPEELTIESVPNVLAEIKLYGKQTDREARLELIVSDDHCKDESLSLLNEVFGQLMQGDGTESELGKVSVIDRVFRVDWHLPKGTNRDQFDTLMEQYFPAMLDQYKQLSFHCLDGKTISEAAKIDQYKTRVHGLLVQLRSLLADRKGGKEASQKFITELGVTLPGPLDPASVESVAELPPFQMQFLDLKKLSNEDLFDVHRSSMVLQMPGLLLKTVDEMLERDGFDLMPRDLMLSMKAQATHDDDAALACLEEARAEAKKEGKPIGQFLLQEFEMRLERGLTEKLPSLLQTLRTNHLQEPGIEASLAQLLHRYGLIDEDQIMRGRANAMDPAVSSMAVPPAAEPAAAPASADEPSKLWLPD